ncbi:MAG: MerR family DNA-binding transcriptional regulator [Acidimicrobiales bacterium]|nr:MAG: MerR family DNA-binding transcriptional regulator [Acidimicrobiales bacterium]
MSEYRMGEAAQLLGVSTDMVRRWADDDTIATTRTPGGHRVIAGAELADFAVRRAESQEDTADHTMSARNRFEGLVTKVTADTVMAQVELQCGPNRIVALISAEAVADLGLAPGVRAVATVKATNVIVEAPSA